MADTLYNAYGAECEKRRSVFVPDKATEEAVAAVAEWLTSRDKRESLLLYGGAGNGKTTMLRAVHSVLLSLKTESDALRADVEYGRKNLTMDELKALQAVIGSLQFLTVSFATASDIVRASATDPDRLETWARCGLLLLDDLGRESLAVRHYGTELFPTIDLLCRRYDGMLPTIATSNLTDRELETAYGERMGDRIAEYFDKVAYTNRSYRRA